MEDNYNYNSNHFDRLSDDLLRLIFNRVIDANSLCSCLSVSKRFSSIVPQTNNVSINIPRRNVLRATEVRESEVDEMSFSVSEKFLRFCIGLFVVVVINPIVFLHRVIVRDTSEISSDEVEEENSIELAGECLKSFDEIETFKIQIPSYGGEAGFDGDSLLKWKAEFGNELKTCVMICATSLQNSDHQFSDGDDLSDKQRLENTELESSESILRSDELKLRIVCLISSIIAASSRHFSLKQMIINRSTIQQIVVTDEKRQGILCMNQNQIDEMRNLPISSKVLVSESSSESRTRVPALSVKMCYVPALELPVTGKVMKGATLVVVRAVDSVKLDETSDYHDLLEGAFDGDNEEQPLIEAVTEMIKIMKKKVFTMEIDPF